MQVPLIHFSHIGACLYTLYNTGVVLPVFLFLTIQFVARLYVAKSHLSFVVKCPRICSQIVDPRRSVDVVYRMHIYVHLSIQLTLKLYLYSV